MEHQIGEFKMRRRSRSGREELSQRELDTIEIVEELLEQRKVCLFNSKSVLDAYIPGGCSCFT